MYIYIYHIYVFTYIYIHIYISHICVYIYIYIYIINIIYIIYIKYINIKWFFEVGFEPTTTEFRSDALTDWAIRPRVQLALRANVVQPLQFHGLFSVAFHFGYYFGQSPRFLKSKFCWGNHMSVAEWVETYGIHHRRIL